MYKKYKINQKCIVNWENPTPVKEMEVAINIEAKNENDKFVNFVLGIEGGTQ